MQCDNTGWCLQADRGVMYREITPVGVYRLTGVMYSVITPVSVYGQAEMSCTGDINSYFIYIFCSTKQPHMVIRQKGSYDNQLPTNAIQQMPENPC